VEDGRFAGVDDGATSPCRMEPGFAALLVSFVDDIGLDAGVIVPLSCGSGLLCECEQPTPSSTIDVASRNFAPRYVIVSPLLARRAAIGFVVSRNASAARGWVLGGRPDVSNKRASETATSDVSMLRHLGHWWLNLRHSGEQAATARLATMSRHGYSATLRQRSPHDWLLRPRRSEGSQAADWEPEERRISRGDRRFGHFG
jgi:hypothetical protein